MIIGMIIRAGRQGAAVTRAQDAESGALVADTADPAAGEGRGCREGSMARQRTTRRAWSLPPDQLPRVGGYRCRRTSRCTHRTDRRTHKTDTVGRWLAAHPRFHVHFVPASSSWLNQVERWFAELTTKLLQRGVHTSVQALEADLRAWIQTWDDKPGPFVWTKSADEILASLARYVSDLRRRTLGPYHPLVHLLDALGVFAWTQ
jgi:DDE superfamily endonuclease